MKETINRLREQPEEHRTFVAAVIAIGVVALLFIGWVFLFVHGLRQGDLEYTRQDQTGEDTSIASTTPDDGAGNTPTIATSSAPAAQIDGF